MSTLLGEVLRPLQRVVMAHSAIDSGRKICQNQPALHRQPRIIQEAQANLEVWQNCRVKTPAVLRRIPITSDDSRLTVLGADIE